MDRKSILKTMQKPIFEDKRSYCNFCFKGIDLDFNHKYFCEKCLRKNTGKEVCDFLNEIMKEFGSVRPRSHKEMFKDRKKLSQILKVVEGRSKYV